MNNLHPVIHQTNTRACVPVVLLLDNIRSAYNVGSIFRTADAAGVQKLYLCGITPKGHQIKVRKTALGAEEVVPWEHSWDGVSVVRKLKAQGYRVVGAETLPGAVDIFEWSVRFPACIVLGNEVSGIQPELQQECEEFIKIPMLGIKQSINVAVAAGVICYEVLRQFRSRVRRNLEQVPAVGAVASAG